ncbi:MAG: patatin-like phospholipase family protein [bacterium]|nr:patatin-like phospholipase family protein [bacterium]
MADKKNVKRALCLSGGGAKGAWAGGVIQYLTEDLELDYNLYVGTSTGSLLAPLTSIREINILKQGYTSVSADDIFSYNPFRKNGNPSYFRMAYRIATLNNTLGESENLLELIQTFFQKKHYDRLKNDEKEIIAAVANITDETIEYKSSKDWGYDMFCKWLWASANVPPFMSLFEYQNKEYVDGGILQHIPIQAAIDAGATEIDVIVLRPENFGATAKNKAKNVLHLANKLLRMMQRKISKYNVEIAQLNANKKDVKINIIYTPYRLAENSLLFDKEQMLKWWEEGYEFAKEGNMKQYKLSKRNVMREIE